MSQSQCGRSPSQAGYPYALVSHYLTNKLMGRGPLLERQVRRIPVFSELALRQVTTFGISTPFGMLSPTQG